MKAKQIAILLALTTMMIAGCGSNTKNADSQTEVSTSTETTDEASSDETETYRRNGFQFRRDCK